MDPLSQNRLLFVYFDSISGRSDLSLDWDLNATKTNLLTSFAFDDVYDGDVMFKCYHVWTLKA